MSSHEWDEEKLAEWDQAQAMRAPEGRFFQILTAGAVMLFLLALGGIYLLVGPR